MIEHEVFEQSLTKECWRDIGKASMSTRRVVAKKK